MQANHQKVNRKLSIAKGQIEGILKMIENDEYCIDISNQILATIQLLKNANLDVISAHLNHCVKNAKNDDDLETKMSEINALLKRMSD